MPHDKNKAEVPELIVQRHLNTNQSPSYNNFKSSISEENLSSLNDGSHKMWYFNKKKDLVTTVNVSQLPLFHKEDPFDDRIVNQLLYLPPNYKSYYQSITTDNYKKIYLSDGPAAFYKVKYGK